MPRKKVISFSLFGRNPMYFSGAIENAKLARKFYPEWVCRFYVSRDADMPSVLKLSNFPNVEISFCYGCSGFTSQWVRMEVAMDSTVKRFVVRDADSRLNAREADAVMEWEKSDKPFHIMRDHKRHTAPIMGGMWGAVYGFIPPNEFEGLYRKAIDFVKSGKSKGKEYYKKNGVSDQGFLGNKIFPLIRTNHLAHDDKKRMTKDELKFSLKLPSGLFVGQQYTRDNKPIKVK